jgi:hypothetical protein
LLVFGGCHCSRPGEQPLFLVFVPGLYDTVFPLFLVFVPGLYDTVFIIHVLPLTKSEKSRFRRQKR